jgi:hypothetical protein
MRWYCLELTEVLAACLHAFSRPQLNRRKSLKRTTQLHTACQEALANAGGLVRGAVHPGVIAASPHAPATAGLRFRHSQELRNFGPPLRPGDQGQYHSSALRVPSPISYGEGPPRRICVVCGVGAGA